METRKPEVDIRICATCVNHPEQHIGVFIVEDRKYTYCGERMR